MLILRGSPALSHFRIERLLVQMSSLVPQANALTAETLYFVSLETDFKELENKLLFNLLHTSRILERFEVDLALFNDAPDQATILVIPKANILSGWSQLATKIAQVCGLKSIRRIEKGILYQLKASDKLTWGDKQAIASLLYDPHSEKAVYQFSDIEYLLQNKDLPSVQIMGDQTITLIESDKNSHFFPDETQVYKYHLPCRDTVAWVRFSDNAMLIAADSSIKSRAVLCGLHVPMDALFSISEQYAQFNNEFGCPLINGYLSTHQQYSNPLILSGGIGNISQAQNHVTIAALEPQIEKTDIKSNQNFTTAKRILDDIAIEEAVFRLLKLPCIGDKSFLMHCCDRTVTGLVVRDPMAGPWQVPVADCAVVAKGFDTYQGIAMAVGERSLLAMKNPLAGLRMAISEAITNIMSANVTLSDIHLIVNWSISPSEKALQNVYERLKIATVELCSVLGINLTIGTSSNVSSVNRASCTFAISVFSEVIDVRYALTPFLNLHEETALVFIDLSNGYKRLGGSALTQIFNQDTDKVPDVENPLLLKIFFETIQKLQLKKKILAYHDRSDGGLLVTLCEMAFASHVGLKIDISELGLNKKAILFNEELGVVIQIRLKDMDIVFAELEAVGILSYYVIGSLDYQDRITISFQEEVVFSADRILLQKTWSETSFQLQSLRDNPRCAKSQHEAIGDREDPGLNAHLTFDPNEDITAALVLLKARPRIAILREQGTEGYIEMAAAFDRAQFECIDVNMTALQEGKHKLSDFKGLAICGRNSFGDVLGAGQGWAKRILFNAQLSDQFASFFKRDDTFTLGVSNGCQVLAYLKDLIPQGLWIPRFIQNYSEQFESRLCVVEVQNTSSIFLRGMEGSRLLIPVAHKEGRAAFECEEFQESAIKQKAIALRYIDNRGRKTTVYPANPDGSILGIAGLTAAEGRILMMMPYPERAFRSIQYSWHPDVWKEDAPWLRLFRNARYWVG